MYERVSMQENTISVCYSGNKRVFPGLLLSVLSLAKFTDRPLRVYALTMDLHEVDPAFIPFSEEQIAVLDAVLKEKNPESAAMRIDVSEKFRAELADGKNTENFYTPYTLLRLYMDGFEMFPDKIVYLDIDTMCASDIGQLYDVDLGDAEYGAVLDHMGKFWINRHYCNAGVLLLNLARIRETKLFERAREYVYTHKMMMPDQTALHRLCTKRVYLPRRFNEQRDLRDDTVVKHFCRGIRWVPFFHIYNYKQWERNKVHKKLKIFYFDDLYEKFDSIAAKYDITK